MQDAGQTADPVHRAAATADAGAPPADGVADAGATPARATARDATAAGATPAGPTAPASRGPGDLLVPAGVVLFGIGVAAVVVVVAMFLVTGGEVPLALSLGAALGPAGLGLALLGLLRQGRAASREARRRRDERRVAGQG